MVSLPLEQIRTISVNVRIGRVLFKDKFEWDINNPDMKHLHADKPAGTVEALSPPVHYNGYRCITVREAACLQSFPMDYEFHGTLAQQYAQIGNAVPIELATAVAQSIKVSLRDIWE